MRSVLQSGHDRPLAKAGSTLTLPAAILRGSAARGLGIAAPDAPAPALLEKTTAVPPGKRAAGRGNHQVYRRTHHGGNGHRWVNPVGSAALAAGGQFQVVRYHPLGGCRSADVLRR